MNRFKIKTNLFLFVYLFLFSIETSESRLKKEILVKNQTKWLFEINNSNKFPVFESILKNYIGTDRVREKKVFFSRIHMDILINESNSLEHWNINNKK